MKPYILYHMDNLTAYLLLDQVDQVKSETYKRRCCFFLNENLKKKITVNGNGNDMHILNLHNTHLNLTNVWLFPNRIPGSLMPFDIESLLPKKVHNFFLTGGGVASPKR